MIHRALLLGTIAYAENVSSSASARGRWIGTSPDIDFSFEAKIFIAIRSIDDETHPQERERENPKDFLVTTLQGSQEIASSKCSTAIRLAGKVGALCNAT